MKQWRHAPFHILNESGTFMVTAATYNKQPYFNSARRIRLLHDTLFDKSAGFGWEFQAWAFFPNHYHFIATSPEHPENLRALIRNVHGATAKRINNEDGTPGRRVWFQYWDSRITIESSYFARLNYVHNNPVHHGIADDALKYRWCSASWFEKSAEESLRKIVARAKSDRINVHDDF